jgi:cytochrome c oxidase cbb3-type subunit III
MRVHNTLLAATLAGFAIVATHVAAQETAQPPAPAGAGQQPPAAPGPQNPTAGRGQGRGGRGGGVFPAQQRLPGNPAVIERGRTLFGVNCTACHGADARGGQLGGPNLLRSQLVLADQDGELIVPVVQKGRPEKGMPPFPLSAEDSQAIAEFIHSLTAAGRGQGSPPPSDAPPPNILIGDATAGQTFFGAKCGSCHSATGDLQGIASKVPDAKTLQNLWVSGGMGGGRGGRGEAATNGPVVTVTVTPPVGEKAQGRLVRIDDFIVSLMQEDGTVRSFRRDGDVPKVEIQDPLDGHRSLLAVYTDKDMHDVTAYLATLK